MGPVLVVAHRDVVGDRVARDVLERPLARHAPGPLADHHGDLALVIDRLAFGRERNVVVWAGQRRGELGEQHRVVGVLALGLLDVRGVVQADTDDLAGPGHDRAPAHLRQRHRRVGLERRIAQER